MRHFGAVLAAVLLVTSAALADTQRSPDAALPDLGGAATSRASLAAALPVTAAHAMVVTAQHLATDVGTGILKSGGNAVDAAVAVGYALAVVHPCCGNIGGGGFMTVHLADGGNLFLDFREKAPLAATPTMFLDAEGNADPELSRASWLATGVPGTVMGLSEALARFGTMSRAAVMAPAIALAKDGFVLNEADAHLLGLRTKLFAGRAQRGEDLPASRRHAPTGGRAAGPARAGEDAGADRDRTGPTPSTRARSPGPSSPPASTDGGLFTLQDFADYTAPWSEPVACDYRGYRIVSAPPPSSGGTTLCEILQIVAPYPFAKWGYASTEVTHYARRGRAPRLRRPQHLSRRPGLRDQPGRAAAVGGACRDGARDDRTRPRHARHRR